MEDVTQFEKISGAKLEWESVTCTARPGRNRPRAGRTGRDRGHLHGIAREHGRGGRGEEAAEGGENEKKTYVRATRALQRGRSSSFLERREYIPKSLIFSRTHFGRKRENAVSTNERLQQEAQAVLDVIENPDVAQALQQDKNQNPQYLKDNYDVSFVYAVSTFLTGFFSSRSLPWNKSPPSTTLDTSSIHTETIVTAEPRFFFDSN